MMRSRRGKSRSGLRATLILGLAALAIAALAIWKPAQMEEIAAYWQQYIPRTGSEDAGQAKPEPQAPGKNAGNAAENAENAAKGNTAADNVAKGNTAAENTANGDTAADNAAKGDTAAKGGSHASVREGRVMARAVSLQAVADSVRKNATSLDNLQISANGMFSFAKFWQANKLTADDTVASVFYEAAIRAGFAVGERHIHRDLPEGLAPGFDVDVAAGKDLALFNPYSFAVTCRVGAEGDKLAVELLAPENAEWQTPTIAITQETFPAEQINLVDFALPAGGTVKREAGKDGVLIKVAGKINGEQKVIAKDFYAPHPAVIARAPSDEERKMAASGVGK
ncbi:MAG TPA: hypothetical protein VF260_02315 [Bacilli bacterium]